uniref:Conotoxin n=1 Tax=Conus betulinus TaxID=89764 RepID=A0A142C1G2_CONBE|nr:conotoxin [Conus betulinus]
MKLSLAIVLILMLLSLSTGAETSDNRASGSTTALRDRLLGPKAWRCQELGERCSDHDDCCGWLCCAWPHGGCAVSFVGCK